MDFSNYNIGLGITGSFCTFAKARKEIQRLCDMGANVVPVFSFNAQTCDTRFGSAKDYVDGICEITGNEGIRTICAAEPIGPNNFLDIMVIAPCTGNTAAKLCNGITDTPVLMATKAHMRNGKPLVIAISTNDALGASFKNIGMLMNMKNIYFVPSDLRYVGVCRIGWICLPASAASIVSGRSSIFAIMEFGLLLQLSCPNGTK